MIAGFEHLRARYGDLHNHCDLSYARGTPDEALANARLQLDFVSLTVHGAWPDVPTDDPALAYLVDYHHRGFERARAGWDDYLVTIDAADESGVFVTLPSFEWHSMAYGDHCVYFRDTRGARILDAPDLGTLRAALREIPGDTFLIPHHVGYRQGLRGIDWSAFDPELSPVVETVSFHGSSERSDGAVPYLHAMGPRHEHGTAGYAWSQGLRFGVIGSTDHHNAVPGSYGFGRMGAWMRSLDRDGLWDAIAARRTYALTGDRIDLAFALNGTLMGGVAPAADERRIEVEVRGGAGLDWVEILHDERVVHRASVFQGDHAQGPVKVHVEVGWGEATDVTPWDVTLRVRGGELLGTEGRFRGPNPHEVPPVGTRHAPHTLERPDADSVRFTTLTRPNPLSALPAMEGVCLEIRADDDTVLEALVNGRALHIPLRDLHEGSRTHHVGGFVSPAICFHRAVPEAEYALRLDFTHRPTGTSGPDLYRIRVRQRNDHMAWSSPIWVEPRVPTRR
jgi:hypothetical protein